MKSLSINVKGKVQGVYFRASTKSKADKLQLKGTVMNLPNGSVQIEVIGEEEVLNQFIEWCHEGSERAEVKEVICVENDGVKGFVGFEVIRKEH